MRRVMFFSIMAPRRLFFKGPLRLAGCARMTRHQSHRGFSSFLSTETLFFRTNLAQQRDDERLIPGALRHRPAIPVGCIVGAGRASRASEESRAGCGGNGEAVEASAAVRTVGGGSGAIRKTPAETGTQEGSLQTTEAVARARAKSPSTRTTGSQP